MDGFGLVFGWNTLVAVCLQSILTLIVVDKNGLDLPESKQVQTFSGQIVLDVGLCYSLRQITIQEKSPKPKKICERVFCRKELTVGKV